MNEFEQDVKNCIECMHEDGVFLYPTDTIWGLGCDVSNEKSIRKIIEIKKRDATKSFVLLMTDIKQLSKYIANTPLDLDVMLAQFEKPTTIIYENAINLPSDVIGPDNTVAVRITKDPFCRSLIKRLRKPIVSTSANLSGMPSPVFFDHVDSEIKSNVDYIVRWRQEDRVVASPSSILKLNKDGSFLKIR